MSDLTPTAAPEDTQLWPSCRLARMIGKPSAGWSVDDLVGIVGRLGIRVVSLMHVGGDGWLKTLDFVPGDEAHLREVLSFGERADGSSLFGAMGIPVTASDVVLRPRLSTAFVDPFASYPTLVVFCGHYGRDGNPLPESPDTILRKAFARLQAELGVELQALGEVEFFLGKRPEENDIYGAAERGYHASSPFVFGEPLRRRAMVMLAEIGIPVKYGHSEVGYIQPDEADARIWEQHEIELALQPLPEAADAVLIAQWLLRNLAHKSGWRCSFDPILRKGHAGSGLHFHFSPVIGGLHQKHSTPDGRLQGVARWLIAGLAQHAGALMAFGNRAPNSFVRLLQAKEAPSTISWGHYNRRALIRLPIVATNDKGDSVSPETVEFRLPDGSAHPHLLLAGIAQAMVAGKAVADLDEVLEHTWALTRKGSTAEPVPRNVQEVADRLAEHRASFEAGGVFPAQAIDRTVEALRQL
jgi:glutamine synthetase